MTSLQSNRQGRGGTTVFEPWLEEYETTVASECNLEVDFDDAALAQITYLTNRLRHAVHLRHTSQERHVAEFSSRELARLRELASSKGKALDEHKRDLDLAVVAVNEKNNQLHLEETLLEPVKTLDELLAELEEHSNDARSVCAISRNTRGEVVYLFIVDEIVSKQEQFLNAILCLRELVLRFKTRARKGEPLRPVYIHNIEVRLQHLESLYEQIFGSRLGVDVESVAPASIWRKSDVSVDERIAILEEEFSNTDSKLAKIREGFEKIGRLRIANRDGDVDLDAELESMDDLSRTFEEQRDTLNSALHSLGLYTAASNEI